MGTNPYSIDGVDWLLQARGLKQHILDQYQIEIYYVDGASGGYDAVHAVYLEFPVIIGVTLCLVFALMAFSFRSISAPLRLIVTIVLTLAFVYGLAVLTYQNGALSWFHSTAFANYHSMNWLPPGMFYFVYLIFLM